MNHSTCGGFTVQDKFGCLYLEESAIPKLVKTSSKGSKSKEVWVKESLVSGMSLSKYFTLKISLKKHF